MLNKCFVSKCRYLSLFVVFLTYCLGFKAVFSNPGMGLKLAGVGDFCCLA